MATEEHRMPTDVVTRERLGNRIAAEEWRCRVELAACYRLMAHLGVEDLTYNHISARIPGEADALLVKPHDFMFREVTASSLLKFKLDGTPISGSDRPLPNALHVIHANVMRLRAEVHCIVHTHTPANVAVSAQECGLLPISQHAMMFYNRIARHAFGGFEFDCAMKDPLARDLGTKWAALLTNHGVWVAGGSVGEAFVRHHFLEMACRIQVAALAGGQKIVIPALEVCEFAARQLEEGHVTLSGGKDWAACLRLADRLDPSYKT
jgi:ribulose-5-phosphate 4-epimerase/fuculose-1-phosphate aldolase